MKLTKDQILTVLANEANYFAEEIVSSQYIINKAEEARESAAHWERVQCSERHARLAIEGIIADVLDIDDMQINFII